ncbi:MAG: SpoIIE family protein phosphatase [Gammaproteobacteria bacterium]|nr:SpoIIE family protein phosphatase [Gammaproteobacteria bacterium]
MTSGAVLDLFEKSEEHSLEEQLGLLAEITQSFALSLDINETLQNALERFLEYLHAEADSIFLLENDDTELVCRGCAGPVDITGLRLPADAGIVGKTVTSRSCQIVKDVSKDPNFSQNVDKDTGFVTRSILCAPLMVNERCIGCLELINKRTGDGLFEERDQNLLMALAAAAALAIHNARMADKLVVQERMQKELELAREIQESLLPDPVGSNFPVFGMNLPAREVSGDFFDFFQREDGLIYFNLADVSGKGMNAALLMAKTTSLLRHAAKGVSDAGKHLATVNDEICETVSHGMFITIVSGFIDTEKKIIEFANAGHQPPLYHHKGKFEEIDATAPPLGIISGAEFPVSTLPLDEGSLYLFTDGVTEAEGDVNGQLDVSGLIKLIEARSELNGAERLQGIVHEIYKPDVDQHDDITIMLIEDQQS